MKEISTTKYYRSIGYVMLRNQDDRKLLWWYWSIAAFIICVAIVGAIQLSRRDLAAQFSEAEHNGRVLVNALAGHTQQISIKLEAVGDAVVDDMKRLPEMDGLSLQTVLKRRATAEPAAHAIVVFNSAGQITASSNDSFSAISHETITEILEAHDSAVSDRYFISSPHYVNDTQNGWSGWTVSFSRRIRDNEGSLTGFISVILDGQFLYEFYDRIGDNRINAVGLIGDDGIIRVSNRIEAIGRSTESLVDTEIRDNEGSQISTSSVDDLEYLFIYSKAPASPFYAYVGVPTAPLFRKWYTGNIPIIATLSVIIAALLGTGALLQKYVKSRRLQLLNAREAASEKRSREFLQAVLNTGGALVAVTNVKGDLVVGNPAFHHFFDIEHKPPEVSTLEFVFSRSMEQLAKVTPFQTSVTTEDKNGDRREIAWTLNSIVENENEVAHYVAIGFDFTLQRKAELAVYQAGKLISLGEMATGLAHEINQPLATMAMTVDVLKDRISSGSAQIRFIKERLIQLGSQLDRTSSIVDRMRVFGRQSELQLEVFSPMDAIKGSLVILEPFIENSKIDVAVKRETQDNIIADKILLEQILLNLLSNARDSILSKSPESNDPERNITIRLRKEDDCTIAIDIIDTGVGFSTGDATKLFDPFFTTKPVGKGTGLGLPLSSGMATDMGGRIEACNLGDGARFTVYLPVAQLN